jgi:hypothetical protein
MGDFLACHRCTAASLLDSSHAAAHLCHLIKIRSPVLQQDCYLLLVIFSTVVKCGAVADIIFVLDTSSSMSPQEFQLEKEFAIRLSEHFFIGKYDTRFAALSFSDRVVKMFDLKDYADHNDLKTVRFCSCSSASSCSCSYFCFWLFLYGVSVRLCEIQY